MIRDLVSEKPTDQSAEETNLKQNGQIRRKRRMYLESLSITCSAVGVIIVIACFYGITDVFGLKSPEMIFKCAFAFLFTGVILGVLAMISSALKYECLQISALSTSECSLFYTLFRVFCNSRNKYIEDTKNVTSTVNPELEKSLSAYVKTSNANEKSQVTQKRPDALLRVQPKDDIFSSISPGQSTSLLERKNRQYEVKPRVQPTVDSSIPGKSTAPLVWKRRQYEDRPSVQPTVGVSPGQSSELLQWKKKEYEDKPLIRLQKRQTEFLFSQCMTTQVSSQYMKSSSLVLYDMGEESNERLRLVPIIQESFIAEFDINKHSKSFQSKQRNTLTQRPHIGIHPYNGRNKNFEEGCNYNFPKGFTHIETFQKQPKDQVSDVTSKLNEMNFLS